MKPFVMKDDFMEVDSLRIQDSGDWEYPFNIAVNDGFGVADISFTRAEAEAMRNWLNEALLPLENK